MKVCRSGLVLMLRRRFPRYVFIRGKDFVTLIAVARFVAIAAEGLHGNVLQHFQYLQTLRLVEPQQFQLQLRAINCNKPDRSLFQVEFALIESSKTEDVFERSPRSLDTCSSLIFSSVWASLSWRIISSYEFFDMTANYANWSWLRSANSSRIMPETWKKSPRTTVFVNRNRFTASSAANARTRIQIAEWHVTHVATVHYV